MNHLAQTVFVIAWEIAAKLMAKVFSQRVPRPPNAPSSSYQWKYITEAEEKEKRAAEEKKNANYEMSQQRAIGKQFGMTFNGLLFWLEINSRRFLYGILPSVRREISINTNPRERKIIIGI